MTVPCSTWRIAIRIPAEGVDAFELAIEPFCVAVSRFVEKDEKTWRLEGDCVDMPDPERLGFALTAAANLVGIETPDLAVQTVAGRDWIAETVRAFPPLRVGRFFIHGTHFEGTVPTECIALHVDAGAAFGSGEHATTSGCLIAMQDLGKRRQPKAVLDMGCGSGILALAAAKMWRRPVVAVDNDPIAIEVTVENAHLNGVPGLIRAACGDGYATPIVRQHEPYDLVIANILARPLRRMAKDLHRYLKPGGKAVLSGLIERDVHFVLSAHQELGFTLQRSIIRDGWASLVLKR